MVKSGEIYIRGREEGKIGKRTDRNHFIFARDDDASTRPRETRTMIRGEAGTKGWWFDLKFPISQVEESERERTSERPGLKSSGGGGRMQRSNTRTRVVIYERSDENDGGREEGGWVADQRQQRAFARPEFFFDDFRSEGGSGEVRGFTCSRGTRVSLSSHLAGFDDARCCCAGNTRGRGEGKGAAVVDRSGKALGWP